MDRNDLGRTADARDQMDREYARPLDVEVLARADEVFATIARAIRRESGAACSSGRTRPAALMDGYGLIRLG